VATLALPVDDGRFAKFRVKDNPSDKEIVMKSFKCIAHSLLLTLALATSAFAADKVNINTADAATIDRVLVNIGSAKAEAIVAYRKQHGAFKSAEQLAQVKGIGLKTVEKNRDRIVVGSAPARAPAKPAKAAKKPVTKR
jgi:competence protein ComEA